MQRELAHDDGDVEKRADIAQVPRLPLFAALRSRLM